MKNELLTIGSFTVYGYGFMIAVGILAAWITIDFRAARQKLDRDCVFYLIIWCLVGGICGAKLLYWITEWESILKNPGFLLDSIADGFVVYGGIIGGILAGWLYCRHKKISFLKYFDLAVPSVALAQGFGRIGCLLAGCCYGSETSGFFSITFRTSDFAPNNVALIPTQIYSSILDFVHFGVLLLIARHKKSDGQVAACYLIFYSLGRFVLEFFRGDLIRGSVGVLSTSQFISLFTGFAGAVMLYVVSKKKSI
ncbi:prolipoprotein diacylglyceryl transferase [Blautia sp. HCP28S3_G10]|uniref:prolipoprotein diacylglyceryl transferase n=1 Tax=Blautia sp. HCP28S3_G10 TaxID=3438908 RepID=UPI003F893426